MRMPTTALDRTTPSPGPSHLPEPPMSPPVIVFVANARWESFFQLGAFPNRAGCRVVRVTSELHRKAALASRALFDRFVEIPGSAGLARLPDILAGEAVVD